MNKLKSIAAQQALSNRIHMRKHYLSASLGLVCGLVPTAAYASGGQHGVSFTGMPAAFSPHSLHSSNAAGASNAWTSLASSFAVHGAIKQATQQSGAGKAVSNTLPALPSSLNLSSSAASFSLPNLGNVQTLTITVGGKSEVINLTTKLTGAELLAADQVLGGGKQTLTINSQGIATGGFFDLSKQSLTAIDASTGCLNALEVPRNVRIIDSLSNLQLSGDLINSGKIIVQPQSGGAASIEAFDIVNGTGATIAATGQGANAPTLNLVADHQLTNNGLITTGNNLNIAAPQVVNSGILKSVSADINFSSNVNAAINNTNGSISAASGNINASTAAANGDINIEGGNLFSRQVNLNAGAGNVNVNVGNLSGLVNVNACSAHINATTANLQLGVLNVSGDPTYYNQGNITITTAMAPTNGQDLAIIASGNILSNGGSLNTSSTTGAGGNLLLVAGASFTTSDNSTSGNNNAATTLTLSLGPGVGGGSITGGLIDLSGGNGGKAPITAITTAGAGNGDSGAVTMLAFAGTLAKSGSVTLPSTFTLNTATAPGGTGASGDVTIIAGASKGSAISVGNIDTSQGAGGQGFIQLAAARPPEMTPLTITNGTVTMGSFTGILKSTTGSIVMGNLLTGGGNVNVSSSGTVTFQTVDTSGRGGLAVFQGAGTDGGNAGIVNISAGASLTGNNVFAYGGGGGGGSIDGANNGTSGGGGGSGSTITLSSMGTIVIKGMLDSSGGGGGGGGGASFNGTAGVVGGAGPGGIAGNILLSSPTVASIAGGVFSVTGAGGGDGGTVIGNAAGAGGGGGASYGGGGGGGAAGNDLTALPSAGGGGGGGGFYGGGGGSGVIVVGASNLGGNGGGFQSGGAGGTGATTSNSGIAGTKLSGGNGAASSVYTVTGQGGALGLSGTGGGANGNDGSNGGNIIVAGSLLQGGTLTINSATGNLGTAQAPLNTLVNTLTIGLTGLKASAGSIFVSDGAGLLTTFQTLGNFSLKAGGDIFVFGTGSIIGNNVSLSTTAASNGTIDIFDDVTATNLTLQAGGSGQINMLVNTSLLANSVTLISNTGAIGSSGHPVLLSNFQSSVSVNSNATAYVASQYNLNLQKSSVTGSTNTLNVNAGWGLTVTGAVSAPGGLVLDGGRGLTLAANVSSSNGPVLLTSQGGFNIVEKSVAINTPDIIANIDAGTIGTAKSPFITDAGVFIVNGNATDPNTTRIYINDTNGGTTTVEATGNGGNLFSVVSSANQLNYDAAAYVSFAVINISKTGTIILTNNSGIGGNGFISTIGGNVTQTTGTIDAYTLTLKSTSGDFGPLTINTNQLLINTGPNASVNITNTSTSGPPPLTGKAPLWTAGSITLDDAYTDLQNPIKATTVSIVDGGSSLLVEPTATITANSISLTSTNGSITANSQLNGASVSLIANSGSITYGNNIGTGSGVIFLSAASGAIVQSTNSASLKGTSVNLTGLNIGSQAQPISLTAPTLTFASTDNTYANVNGNTALQQSSAGGNLTLTSNGAVTESQNLNVVFNADITAKSFTQQSGATLATVFGGVNIVTSGTGAAVNLEGTINSMQGINLTTAAKGEIQVGVSNNSASLSGSTIKLQTGTLLNDGDILTAPVNMPNGTLTILNPTSDLTITNNGIIGTPLVFNLSSGGKLTITDSSNGIQPFQHQTAENISISAVGTLTLPTLKAPDEILLATDPSGNGGSITIKAASIVYPSSGLYIFTNAIGSGNGGPISITVTGKQNITLNNAPGWILTANGGSTGGSGGNVFISTGGTILDSQTNNAISNIPQVAGFKGGNITLVSGANLVVQGSLDSSGAGSPGSITLTSGGKTPFVIDSTLPFTISSNGATGIYGSTVQITDMAGVNLDSSATITANSLLRLLTSEFTDNGTLAGTFTTALIQNQNGNLTLSGANHWPTSPINLGLQSAGNLNTGTLFNMQGPVLANVDISAKSTLTLDTQDIALAGSGFISITASKLAFVAPVNMPLTLDASGGATSTKGGSVLLTLTGTAPVTLSNTGAGNIDIDASPGSATPTTGATIDVTTGGNLTVNLSGLQTNNNDVNGLYSKVNLQSAGVLLVKGWNDFVIGAAGTLTTSEKSTTPFVIGTATTSGIVSSATSEAIKGQNISITNTGGDVYLSGTDDLFSMSSTSMVNIVAAKNIDAPSGQEAIYAAIVNLNSTGGSIGLGAKGQPTNILQVFTQTLSANAGKGDVFLQQNFFNTPLTLNASSAAVFDLTTAASLIVAGPINAGQVALTTANNGYLSIGNSIGNGTGTVTLTAGAANAQGITQSGGSINATTLNLVGQNATGLQTNITTLTANLSNNLSLNNAGAKLLTVGTSSSALDVTGDATVTTAGALSTGGLISVPGMVVFNAGGTITVNNGLTSASASLNASNGGMVTESAGGSIIASHLTLTSDHGDINTGKGSLNSQNLVLSTSGNIIVNDFSPSTISIAAVTLPAKSFTFTAASGAGADLYLGNIATSNGSISVVFGGSQIITASGSALFANNGNITLQDTLAAGGLFLNPGTSVYASSTMAAFGNVNLFVGAAPKPPVAGTQPTNTLESFSGKGQIFFNMDGAIVANGASFNALGRNINISGQTAASINLNNAVITADPPGTASGAASILPGQSLSIAVATPFVSNAYPNSVANQTDQFAVVLSPPFIYSNTLNSTLPFYSAILPVPASYSAVLQNSEIGIGLADLAVHKNSRLDKPATLFGAVRLNQESSKGNKVLGEEAILIAPDNDTTMQSKLGTIELKRHCLALLIACGKSLTIFNLDDNRAASVVAWVGDRPLTVEPGRHLTLCGAEQTDFAHINPAQFVAHRRLTVKTIGAVTAYRSEFNILSTIAGLPQLRELITSTDPVKQKTAKHLLKTAAILDGLSQGSAEPFELYSNDVITAMNH